MAIGVTTAERARTRLLSEAALLAATTTLAVIWLIGLSVDVWYHLHLGFQIESFFTPAHGVLYGAMTLTGFPALLYLFDSLRLSVPRRERLPEGYLLVLLGWCLYGVGGFFDLAYHTLIGFETSYDAVLSPSHVWLAVAYAVLMLGLIKASVVWRARSGRSGLRMRRADLPLIVSLGLLLRNILWYLTYASPQTTDWATGGVVASRLAGFSGVEWTSFTAHIAGATAIFLEGVIVSLLVVTAVRYLRLPSGGIVIMLGLSASVIVISTDQWLVLVAVLGAALVGELLRTRISPAIEQGYWLLGFSVPFVQTALDFALLGTVGGGLVWTPHLWLGVPLVAGIFGLIASMFVVPPAFIREAG